MKHTDHQSRIQLLPFFLVAALAVVVAAALALAGSTAGTATAAPMRIRVASPRDGAVVSATFTVRISTNVAIGEPGTGRHHVHLYWDGQRAEGRYDIAYAKTFRKKGLAPGRHRLDAVIANADHSTTSAHQSLVVMVERKGAASGGTSPPPTTAAGGSSGY